MTQHDARRFVQQIMGRLAEARMNLDQLKMIAPDKTALALWESIGEEIDEVGENVQEIALRTSLFEWED